MMDATALVEQFHRCLIASRGCRRVGFEFIEARLIEFDQDESILARTEADVGIMGLVKIWIAEKMQQKTGSGAP